MRKLAALLLLIASPSFATVTITNVTGTFSNGNSVTIAVTGQGTKSPAAPWLWADFSSSINPSSLGQDTSWDQIQNMTWGATGGFGSTGGAVGTADVGIWTLRTDKSYWTTESQKNYIFRRTKQNFTISSGSNQNWKIFRCWANLGYPNIYTAANNGRCYVENIGVESGFWSDFNVGTTNWAAEELIWSASSASDTKDGTLTYRVDGVQKANGTILTRSAAAPSYMNNLFPVHGVQANKSTWSPSWSSSNQMWADEVYVDATWQRVMIGDKSTYSACRKFNMLIPSAWSGTSITAQMTTSAFADGETAYVYVFDATNTPNATGYSITISGTVAGNPAPTLSSIAYSTGTIAGGEFNYVLGTGFLSGIVIKVNGVSCTTNLVSSTKAEFILPAGSSGAVEDVTALNSDGQSATLSGAYTRATASSTGNPPRDSELISIQKAVPWIR